MQASPTETGFDILPINAGEAKGMASRFSAAVLKASLPMWDGLPCFLDHDYTGNQSVKNLAGALHSPTWNEQEQGIQAKLLPGGPGAEICRRLRLAAAQRPGSHGRGRIFRPPVHRAEGRSKSNASPK